jgi:hypothetical protein
MKSNLTKLAVAAGAVTLYATASAMAGSVSEQGESVGGAAGAPLPPGVYFIEEDNWGSRTQPNGGSTDVGVNINALVWSTPWTPLGANLRFAAVIPFAEIGSPGTPGSYNAGMFNPILASTLAWNLGNGYNVAYTLQGYIPTTGNSILADPDGDIENRIGLSYLKDGWNFSGNFIYGTHLTNETQTGHPDYFNLDLTANKTFGKWTVGPIAFYSTDTQTNQFSPGEFGKQSQFAVGALVGYDWGNLVTQVYVSRDVYQENYGGYDTRVWGRIIIPLGDPLATPSNNNLMYRKALQ